MLTATFYRRGAGARAVAENKAAAGDARRAAEALRGVLALGQRASEPSKAETAAVLDEATDRLRALQMRVARHAQLVARVKQQEAEVAAARASARVDEVDKGIVETNVRRVNILAESDEVRRDVVLARRRLKVRCFDFAGFGAGGGRKVVGADVRLFVAGRVWAGGRGADGERGRFCWGRRQRGRLPSPDGLSARCGTCQQRLGWLCWARSARGALRLVAVESYESTPCVHTLYSSVIADSSAPHFGFTSTQRLAAWPNNFPPNFALRPDETKISDWSTQRAPGG